MASMEIPPAVQSMINQYDAHNRDNLEELLRLYRAHADDTHDGQASPCGQSLVSIAAMQYGHGARIALIGYAVERLFVLERELARRVAAEQ